MDFHLILPFASSILSLGGSILTLYVGKAVADAKTDLLKDAQARENRLIDKLEEFSKRFEDKLDAKADKAGNK